MEADTVVREPVNAHATAQDRDRRAVIGEDLPDKPVRDRASVGGKRELDERVVIDLLEPLLLRS